MSTTETKKLNNKASSRCSVEIEIYIPRDEELSDKEGAEKHHPKESTETWQSNPNLEHADADIDVDVKIVGKRCIFRIWSGPRPVRD